MSNAKYNAAACKVKALFGKRLTQDDFMRLASMKSVAEIAAYLRNCPGWQKAMETLPGTEIRRGALEDALTAQIQDEFSRIYKFVASDAQIFLMFFIYRLDYEQILLTLRRVQSGGRPGHKISFPEFFLRRSSVDNEALDNCSDYLGLLNAISGSIYYEPLRALIASDGSALPDYTKVSLTLQTVYYITLHEYVLGSTSGKEKQILLEALAGSIDLMNIVHVMRVKKYFPGSIKDVTEVLIPRFFKLEPAFFRALYDAPSLESAYGMLKTSYYGKLFGENNFEYIEQYASLWKYNFDKRQLGSWPPTVYMLSAYIALKMDEMKKLVYIIECVRYGLPVDAAELMTVL